MANSRGIKEVAFCDVPREVAATRRMLERVPEEKWDWKPHEKSMDLGSLATHVATLWEWFRGTLLTDEIDFNNPPDVPSRFANKHELLEGFERYVNGLEATLEQLPKDALYRDWTIRQGEQVYATKPRYGALRIWCLNHMIGHRAQLGMYLRLLDVAVPRVYFCSADEPEMEWD